ncbi:MAG: fused MFS/spermidine synthase [Hyphomonadaceae bacterium]
MQAIAKRAAAPAFAIALFSSAALIFMLQPLFGRMVTPLLGGSPAVWNASMAFFQAALLAGYLYAHLLARLKDLRLQAVIHLAVLIAAFLVLPLHVTEALGPPRFDQPALWLVGVLTLSVGAPFAAASATAPLLQAWYARSGRADAGDPYYLYAASNLGSFVGLLAYPALIEPLFGAHAQSIGWSAGYLAITAMIALCGALVLGARGEAGGGGHAFISAAISWRQRLYWLAAAAIPSSLILGVTQHITTDVASAPMLWVVPLALYLATFIIAFMRGGERFEKTALTFHVPALVLLVISYFAANNWAGALSGILVGFFFSALICHYALARTRPSAEHLTEFYLFVSLGGVIGGALTAFVAPLVFNNVYEYPLALAAACLFRPKADPGMPRLADASAAASVMMGFVALVLLRINSVDAIIAAAAIGAAGALVAAGWTGEGRPAPLRYAFLIAAALQSALMIYFAFNLDAIFTEVIVDNAPQDRMREPWNMIALASSFLTLVFCVHGTVQPQKQPGLLGNAAMGVAIPTLAMMILLALGPANLDARTLIVFGLGFCAIALLFNTGRPFVLAGLVLVAFVIVFLDDRRGGRIVTQERSFFGVLRTRELSSEGVPTLRVLMHGTTIHGAQLTTPGMTRQALTYYHPRTALGEAILAGLATGETSHLALIGLGAGSTACLLRPDDELTIYEIDPAVVRLSARPGGDFTYVPECQPDARIEIGDARLRIAEAPDGAFDVIVVDAFSSDAIPAHLLTREAIALYLSKTTERGVVILHLSNRNLALVSEAARVARDLSAPALFYVSDRVRTEEASFYGGLPASVMVLSRSPAAMGALPLPSHWRQLEAPAGRGWTDDYINLPRALWEALPPPFSGAEECLVYPYVERCLPEGAATAPAPELAPATD